MSECGCSYLPLTQRQLPQPGLTFDYALISPLLQNRLHPIHIALLILLSVRGWSLDRRLERQRGWIHELRPKRVLWRPWSPMDVRRRQLVFVQLQRCALSSGGQFELQGKNLD